MARGNGEGTIYDTIQKIDRKEHRLDFVCNTCKNCNDWSVCNDRTGTNKCQKCTECIECLKKGVCDRFYCYKKSFAQISINGKRKSAGSGKNKKEATQRKLDTEETIKKNINVKNAEYTLSETMRHVEEQKLKFDALEINSYNRNIDTIKTLENHPNTFKKMKDLTEDDIKELLSYFVKLNASQSQLDKNYNAVKRAFVSCKLNTMDDIERNSFISKATPKEVTAFTLEEERTLLKYVNENENALVGNHRCSMDAKTIKNIIKFSLAIGSRIGETCSIDKDKDIDLINNRVTIRRTITKNENKEAIIGTQTKTGRKRKQAKKKDTRSIPFYVLFDTNDFIEIIKEQYQLSSDNPNNTNNLLFCNTDGSLIQHTSFNAIFKRICRQAGIKLNLVQGCNTHMMKHTAVTRMIENGIRLEVISELVGTSVEELEKTYKHVLDEFVEDEILASVKRRNNNISLH